MVMKMYQKPTNQISLFESYKHFIGARLDPENRWVKTAELIPWDIIEEKYMALFQSHTGNVAKPVRMALGALIIKEKYGYSDEETVEQLKENPYYQYFIGLSGFQSRAPFDASTMTLFRKRITLEAIKEVNAYICGKKKRDDDSDPNGGVSSGSSPRLTGIVEENKGNLILDATCAPADIHYPTDLSLLNEAREKLETMVDRLHENQKGSEEKPRTYRKKARQAYLRVEKKKKPTWQEIRRALRKQLGFIARNIRIVSELLKKYPQGLSRRQLQDLETILKLFDQQKYMYENRTHQVENRIVSIHQPHVRPIVRGKKTAEVEFGAKVAISLVGGYAEIEKLSWDAFNEGNTLVASIEAYKARHGYYPAKVIADKIYRNRENLRFCEGKGIHLHGPRLGRPNKDLKVQAAQRKQEIEEAGIRNGVEGKFGEGKRIYGLNRIMARLKETSETVIGLQFLVMNLGKRLRDLLCKLLECLLSEQFELVAI